MLACSRQLPIKLYFSSFKCTLFPLHPLSLCTQKPSRSLAQGFYYTYPEFDTGKRLCKEASCHNQICSLKLELSCNSKIPRSLVKIIWHFSSSGKHTINTADLFALWILKAQLKHIWKNPYFSKWYRNYIIFLLCTKSQKTQFSPWTGVTFVTNN